VNLPYPLLAALLGAVGFATIEITSRVRGVFAALTPTVWGDATVYVVATVSLALLFLPAFRAARGLASFGAATLYLVLFPPWTAAMAGALDLTIRSAWGDPVRSRARSSSNRSTSRSPSRST
jgi:hypothetical protein